VANRFVNLRRKLDEGLFLIAGRPTKTADVQRFLTLLGDIQGELAHSAKAREEGIPPIPQLSEKWTLAADDNSAVFRIACALAGLRGIDTKPLPLRSQLFPIHHANYNEWLEKVRKDNNQKHNDDPACRIRLHISPQRNLTAMLITLLQQRLSLPSRLDFKDKPLNSVAGVDLADLSAFLMDDSMDSSIAALLPGLSLCKIPEDNERTAQGGEIQAAFALCKLALTPDVTLRSLGVLGEEQNLPVSPQLVPKLAAGNVEQTRQAIEIAWRRLRGSGLGPVMPFNQLPDMAGVDPRRLAAALLVPLNFGATGALAGTVLKNEDSTQTRQH
jgi:CRISPR-associated protein Csx17